MPTRSACPGRGRVRGALRAREASSASSTGSADITACHLGHSLLPTSIAIGDPSDRPWRTPPSTRTSSCSKAMRAPRPTPSRRRRRSSPMSAVVTSMPAGSPSMMATRAAPWDSPAVSQRTMRESSQTTPGPHPEASPTRVPSRRKGPKGSAVRRAPARGLRAAASRTRTASAASAPRTKPATMPTSTAFQPR